MWNANTEEYSVILHNPKEWLDLKKTNSINVDKDVEKLRLSYIVGENEN